MYMHIFSYEVDNNTYHISYSASEVMQQVEPIKLVYSKVIELLTCIYTELLQLAGTKTLTDYLHMQGVNILSTA